jgi:predicted nucleic acid-binding protein
MTVRSFFDTNLLLYTDDYDAPEKQQRALSLLADHRRSRTGVVSTQVLQEYFSAATGKLGVGDVSARRKVELFSRLELVEVGLHTLLAAIDHRRLQGGSIWDALIVRAAVDSGCRVLFTEDSGLRGVDGLDVVNPFT